MSVDIAWDQLDSSLSSKIVDQLNRSFASVTRPSFLGPVDITSFAFGDVQPDVQLVDIRDIYSDFLVDSDDDSTSDSASDEGVNSFERSGRSDSGRLSLSRSAPSERPGLMSRAASSVAGGGMDRGSVKSVITRPMPGFSRGASLLNVHHTPSSHAHPHETQVHSPGDQRGYFGPQLEAHAHRPSPLIDSLTWSDDGDGRDDESVRHAYVPQRRRSTSDYRTSPDMDERDVQEEETGSPHTSLQLHLQITYSGSMRISLTTSLLINYPSPFFMSLPLSLKVTGLAFSGVIVLAYESSTRTRYNSRGRRRQARKRLHISLLDPTHDTAPDASISSSSGGRLRTESVQASRIRARPGERLLTDLVVESEVGEASKHTLRNVAKVEAFILDVARKTLEDESRWLLFVSWSTQLYKRGRPQQLSAKMSMYPSLEGLSVPIVKRESTSPSRASHMAASLSASSFDSDSGSYDSPAAHSRERRSSSFLCKWIGCNDDFDSPETLYAHLCHEHVGRKSTGNLSLKCHWRINVAGDTCGTTCIKRDHITSHMRVHTPLKPHTCSICDKSFKRPQDLKKHEKIHTEQHHHSHKQSKAVTQPAPISNPAATLPAPVYTAPPVSLHSSAPRHQSLSASPEASPRHSSRQHLQPHLQPPRQQFDVKPDYAAYVQQASVQQILLHQQAMNQARLLGYPMTHPPLYPALPTPGPTPYMPYPSATPSNWLQTPPAQVPGATQELSRPAKRSSDAHEYEPPRKFSTGSKRPFDVAADELLGSLSRRRVSSSDPSIPSIDEQSLDRLSAFIFDPASTQHAGIPDLAPAGALTDSSGSSVASPLSVLSAHSPSPNPSMSYTSPALSYTSPASDGLDTLSDTTNLSMSKDDVDNLNSMLFSLGQQYEGSLSHDLAFDPAHFSHSEAPWAPQTTGFAPPLSNAEPALPDYGVYPSLQAYETTRLERSYPAPQIAPDHIREPSYKRIDLLTRAPPLSMARRQDSSGSSIASSAKDSSMRSTFEGERSRSSSVSEGSVELAPINRGASRAPLPSLQSVLEGHGNAQPLASASSSDSSPTSGSQTPPTSSHSRVDRLSHGIRKIAVRSPSSRSDSLDVASAASDPEQDQDFASDSEGDAEAAAVAGARATHLRKRTRNASPDHRLAIHERRLFVIKSLMVRLNEMFRRQNAAA
ncbi:uncharacterized protein L969DRAFT_43032 [Mixia osmundae IAM 14324]|uniref:Mitochondrial distribution and morphology protein 12 n=1 Tax=Mixia osmundae (strain CBS 9802 / IAM 14324 / JCM 22182 / KY 12970) TaxID=764103 RepID=G7E3Y6_MIXOS|nr:uncharacterized protein L969DRAFT_43032 [Mixia osmundae IAM 14324]KEI41992.1 hypothetical protein L969DRAFT_43032 [Mixia osmundae IAM 14324]GAA97546.1 hypothetical protein E5Q_04224 [Mixia osmundae IAM 14324]